MSSSPSFAATTRRRNILISAVGVIVVAAIAVAVILSAVNGGKGTATRSGSSTSTASASPSAPASGAPTPLPSPSPSSPVIDPVFGAPVVDTVPTNQPGVFGDGVAATIGTIASIDATGTQVGEKSGPALQFDVTFSNGGSTVVSLDTVSVNLFYGSDRTPAAPIDSLSTSSGVSGSISPGEKKTGQFTFNVPKGAQSVVSISVAKDPGGAVVVFTRG